MPQAMVVGANGFVGTNLVAALLSRGWAVRGLCRPGSDLRYLAEFELPIDRGDVRDPSVWRLVPAGTDVVFFAAAAMSFWRPRRVAQLRVHVDGLRHMLEALWRGRAAGLVLTSSAAAYGLQPGRLTERSPRRGGASDCGYVRSKALAECEIERAWRRGARVAIAQPTTLLGRYDHKLWPQVIARVRGGRLPGVAPGRTSFASVSEVARAHVEIAERERWGERYLLGGPEASFLEVVQRFAEVAGGQAPRRPLPEPMLRGAAWAIDLVSRVTRRPPSLTPDGVDYLIRRNVVRSDKAIRELDYRPPELDSLVAETCRWVGEAGLLP